MPLFLKIGVDAALAVTLLIGLIYAPVVLGAKVPTETALLTTGS